MHVREGVPIGTGSSAVSPVGGYASEIKIGGPGALGLWRNLYILPSSPLAELQKLLPKAQIEYDPGMSPAEAALLAKRSDLVIAFGIRLEGEGFDMPDLTLPWGQDAMIEAVTAANPNTVVVLLDGQSVGDAVAQQGEGDRPGVVSRPGRRPGDRRSFSPARSTRRAGCRSPSRSALRRRRGQCLPGSARRSALRRRSATTKAPRSAIAGSRRRTSSRCTRSATA